MKDVGVVVDRSRAKEASPLNFGYHHNRRSSTSVSFGSQVDTLMNRKHTSEDTSVFRNLAAELNLEEQVSLLAGADFWRTVPLPAHGIPSIKTTDGPSGARGEFFKNGTRAAVFPSGVSLAATWNVDLIEEIGRHLGEETLARGANVLLAPTVCMHRSPLGGRNFESFSEDPFLTGKLAAAYIRGLQSKNVAATIKHFVGNEQETHRMTINSVIEERALREIYLRPFEIAVRDAGPWAIMSSYNLLNGVHSDMNKWLLDDVLRGEWNYDGTVISDWTGTNSVAESIKAGCDLEMPGPAKWRGMRAMKAITQGELSRRDVEKSAARVIHLIERTIGMNNNSEPPERSIKNPGTASLIRNTGAEGLTLLKNDGNLLPIRGAQRIAVIGPNAQRSVVSGGGSASLNPLYTVTPFQGILNATSAEVTFSQGCDSTKWLPLASEHCRTADCQQGVKLEYYKGDHFDGKPVSVQRKETTDLFLWDSAPKSVLPAYSFRVETTITPQSSGHHTFSFSSVGPGRLFINKALFIDNWNWSEEGEAMFEASQDIHKSIFLEKGTTIELLVESTNEVRPLAKLQYGSVTHKYGGCRIGYQEQSEINLLQEAIDAAKAADIAVVCVGLDEEWESEGYDRQMMDLPKHGSQDRLIEAILKANPSTVIVNQSGSPVSMPWEAKAPAILQAWYQGQEAGNALADVLFGKQNPSGKLPTTFPKRLEDNPSYKNWPGENLEVVYEEGINIGYRHYETKGIQPLFPFGHGLSYTTFEYGKPSISRKTVSENEQFTVTVPITNTGAIAGHEILQGYVKHVKSRLPRPEKELNAFSKVFLEPGQTKKVDLGFDKYSLGYYDTSISAWIAEKGQFEVLVGASSADIRCSVSLEVDTSFTWIF